MANLTASLVTKGDIYWEGGSNNRRFKSVEVTLALSGQGTVANNIPASLFGLTTIHRAHSFRQTDNSIGIVAFPSADGTLLLLKAAATNAPFDYAVTIKGVVMGKE